MKNQIEVLREKVKARFENGQNPEEIKAATEEMAALDEIEKENEELLKQNASLLASYKEIVKGEPVSTKPQQETDSEDEEEGAGLSFEEALQKVLEARKKGE